MLKQKSKPQMKQNFNDPSINIGDFLIVSSVDWTERNMCYA